MKIKIENTKLFLNEVKDVINYALNNTNNSNYDYIIKKLQQIENQYNVDFITVKNHLNSVKENSGIWYSGNYFIRFVVQSIYKYCTINNFDTENFLPKEKKYLYDYLMISDYIYYMYFKKNLCLRQQNKDNLTPNTDFVIYCLWWYFDATTIKKYKFDTNDLCCQFITNKILQLLNLPYCNYFAIGSTDTHYCCVTLDQLQLICNYINKYNCNDVSLQYNEYFNTYTLLFNNELSVKTTLKNENEIYNFVDYKTDSTDKYRFISVECIEQ
jgi:hypothetical protein